MYRETFTYKGKRYDVTGKTKKELADRVMKKKTALMSADDSRTTLAEYIDIWFKTYKSPYTQGKSKEMYKTQINHIKSLIGGKKLNAVTTADLQEIITEHYAQGKSKSTIDKLIIVIRQIFKQAVIDGYIKRDPAQNIIKPKMQRGQGRAFTDEERKIVLEVAEYHNAGLWVKCMLYLGCRPSEVALITGDDVKGGLVHVRGTKTITSDRYIPCPKNLLKSLENLPKDKSILNTQTGTVPNSERLKKWWKSFKNECDRKMGATTYRNKIIESKLQDGFNAYCCRHTYGTDAQRAGVPIDVLCQLMGHEDISTTKKYYIHDNEETKTDAINKLEKFWDNR